MKKIIAAGIFFLALIISTAWSDEHTDPLAPPAFRNWLLQQLEASRQELLRCSEAADPVQLQLHYNESRRHYKSIEFFVEYVSPREAKYLINGPLVPKHDPDQGNRVIYPCGFQRIEELIFTNGEKEPVDTALVRAEIRLLDQAFSSLTDYYRSVEITNGNLLEMCQLELFRIASMNMNGYDATISQTNISESAFCLEGIEQVLFFLSAEWQNNKSAKRSAEKLRRELSLAKKEFRLYPDYEDFNRLDFIVNHINPLNRLLTNLHHEAGFPWDKRKQAIRLQTGFLFGEESFDLRYFSIYYDDTVNLSLQAALGKKLFYDPVLSANNRRSCSSCHNPDKAFSDGIKTSVSIDGENFLRRNAPTLTNVAFQRAFFYDGRAYQLEQQASDVIHNNHEMNSSLAEAVVRLKNIPEYRRLFAEAFAGTPDSGITEYAVQKCLTEYEKTLTSFNSRFDRYLRGEKKALSEREINGYNLFAGKALCGSCHFFPLFNGTVPPSFSDSEYEVIGTAFDSSERSLDGDSGRFCITHIPEQLYAFKTPTIRNIALTAPYMHNGIYSGLDEVVEFYRKGGGAGLGFELSNQTLPFDSLRLNTKEAADIVLFMQALTDTSRLH